MTRMDQIVMLINEAILLINVQQQERSFVFLEHAKYNLGIAEKQVENVRKVLDAH